MRADSGMRGRSRRRREENDTNGEGVELVSGARGRENGGRCN